MEAVATITPAPSRHLLAPCTTCGSSSIQTVRAGGQWWCECMSCGHQGPRGSTSHDAHKRWGTQEGLLS